MGRRPTDVGRLPITQVTGLGFPCGLVPVSEELESRMGTSLLCILQEFKGIGKRACHE